MGYAAAAVSSTMEDAAIRPLMVAMATSSNTRIERSTTHVPRPRRRYAGNRLPARPMFPSNKLSFLYVFHVVKGPRSKPSFGVFYVRWRLHSRCPEATQSRENQDCKDEIEIPGESSDVD